MKMPFGSNSACRLSGATGTAKAAAEKNSKKTPEKTKLLLISLYNKTRAYLLVEDLKEIETKCLFEIFSCTPIKIE
jgi:hypothetical protein